MARMIDGNKLVENLRLIATCWSISPFVSKEKHNGAVNMLREVEREVKKAPTLTPSNEWVSVEDSIPCSGKRVLATDGSFVGEAWYASLSRSWYRYNGLEWSRICREVTHWMPLPKSPKEDE